MNLDINCKGSAGISAYDDDLTISLIDIDMSFLEEIDSCEIVANHDNQKLLDAMDADEIAEWYESNFDVTVIDHSRDVD